MGTINTYKFTKDLHKLASTYAHTVLPDELAPMEFRSTFPPGTVGRDIEYKAAQICAGVWFEEGFKYAMSKYKPIYDDFIKYIDETNEEKSERLKEERKEAFLAGAMCFIHKSIVIIGPENKQTTISIVWDEDNNS